METVEHKSNQKAKTQQQMNGAQAVVHSLLAEEVDLIFGYPLHLSTSLILNPPFPIGNRLSNNSFKDGCDNVCSFHTAPTQS